MTEPIFAYEPRSFAGMENVVELALDLRRSRDHGADDIRRQLSHGLRDVTRNPWVILQTTARERLEEISSDDAFWKRVKRLVGGVRDSRTAEAWFQRMCGTTDSPGR
jgi:hypothetical protein